MWIPFPLSFVLLPEDAGQYGVDARRDRFAARIAAFDDHGHGDGWILVWGERDDPGVLLAAADLGGARLAGARNLETADGLPWSLWQGFW